MRSSVKMNQICAFPRTHRRRTVRKHSKKLCICMVLFKGQKHCVVVHAGISLLPRSSLAVKGSGRSRIFLGKGPSRGHNIYRGAKYLSNIIQDVQIFFFCKLYSRWTFLFGSLAPLVFQHGIASTYNLIIALVQRTDE